MRTKFNTLLLITIILFPMLVFSIITEQYPILITFGIFSLISFMKKKRLKYTDTNIIFAMILAITMGVLIDFPVKESYKYFHYVAAVFYGNIALITIFFTGVIVTFFKPKSILIGINSTLAMASLFYMNSTGHGISKTMAKALSQSYFENYKSLFVSLCIIQLIIIICSFMFFYKFKVVNKKQYKFIKQGIIALSLVFAIMISYFLVKVHFKYAEKLRVIEHVLLDLMSRSRKPKESLLLDGNPDISKSLSIKNKKSLEKIYLRVYNNDNIIYFRTNIYDSYSKGKWTLSVKPDKALEFEADEDNPYITFYKRKDEQIKQTNIYITINPSSYYRKKSPALPNKSNKFELPAEDMFHLKGGCYTTTDWDIPLGYRVYLPNLDKKELEDYSKEDIMLNDEYKKELLLRIPQIVKKQNVNNKKIAQQIVSYFYTNYQWTLDSKIKDKTIDPVLDFIDNRNSGHCEMFASSAVVLLRALDIPARYITGLVCVEKDEQNNYHIVRGKHAHAWAEVYIESEKQWIEIEPTPAMGIPDGEYKWGYIEGFMEKIKNKFNNFMILLKQGYLAQAIFSLFGLIWNIIIQPFFIISFIVFLILRFIIKKSIKTKKLNRELTFHSPRIQALIKEFKIYEQQLYSKYKIKREEHITIEEWGNELKQNKNISENDINKIINKLKEYQNIRYSIKQ